MKAFSKIVTENSYPWDDYYFGLYMRVVIRNGKNAHTLKIGIDTDPDMPIMYEYSIAMLENDWIDENELDAELERLLLLKAAAKDCAERNGKRGL